MKKLKLIFGIGIGIVSLFLLALLVTTYIGLSAEEKEFKNSCGSSGGTFIKCSGVEGGWGAPWSGSCEPAGKLKCFCPPMKKLVNEGDFCVKELVKSELTPESCEGVGAIWNDCGSKCEIESQGNADIMCATVCDSICQCGTIAGIGCPVGYECKMPEGVADAGGYCI